MFVNYFRPTVKKNEMLLHITSIGAVLGENYEKKNVKIFDLYLNSSYKV